jgi:meso-butanediol dehydrogenase/(S,S)-butanediol dehydrogenase/diacetyl reductase
VKGNDMDFSGKAVLVTGAASGMGAATARQFSASGADVVMVDRNAELALQVAAEIGAAPPLVGDVGDSGFCRQAVSAALERHGRLDILVNAAGIIVRADALGTTDEQWQRVMNVNVNGVFFMSRAAVAVMRDQGKGAIVNFGSIWGAVGAARRGRYADDQVRTLRPGHRRDDAGTG